MNGNIVTDSNYNLKVNDVIAVNDTFQEERPDLSADESVKFKILYEDEDLIVLNKPAGVVVHAGAGNASHTLVNGLVYHCGNALSSGSAAFRPGIVHRIDKDTSGILVAAKNDYAHMKLAEQFSVHSITRKYICFCFSHFQPPCGRIETLITRDKKNRLKMCASNTEGKKAITIFKTLTDYGFASKIECELKTGRTHQIRVHMSSQGHSLIGDILYKTKNYSVPNEIADYVNHFPRQALHAFFLKFIHPTTNREMEFTADLPQDLQELEKILSSFSKVK